MDRTATLLRRTLLCAVLACPLALYSLPAAWGLRALWALLIMPRGPAAPALWRQRQTPWAGLRRAMVSLTPALAAEAALYRLSAAPAFHALTALTGVLIQAVLILRAQKTGGRHLAVCLISIAVFIACTR